MDDTPEVRTMIGERIQQARLAEGLNNQSEFCRQVGVAQPTLYRWEHGTAVPDVFNLHDIARVCRVTMEWIMTGDAPSKNHVFETWAASPKGTGTSPEARAFLGGLPLHGYQPSTLFYDLALVAWEAGLSREEAARAAKVTAARKR